MSSRENRTVWFVKDKICKWKQRKGKKGFVFKCAKFLVMGAMLVASVAGIVEAAPTGGVITGGSGEITQEDTATNIQQDTLRLDINWQTFSTGVTESVNFYQPSVDSVAINRVIGGVPSELRGALTANGRVFILNNAGITFYSTSHVNVGALLATTADILSEEGSKIIFSDGGYAQVSNQGEIHVSNGGFAILAAPHVENTGVIQANLGQIRLASTTDFTLDLRGDGLIEFVVPKEIILAFDSEGSPVGVDNTGTLRSGVINISANLASGIIRSVVNLDGVIDASAFGPGQDGGTVLIDSRGDLNITGEIHADAAESGNGGAIYTWADGVNNFTADAVITARGGSISGDGGFIELSGNDVKVRGDVSLAAPNGTPGTLLIDPPAISIENGTGSATTATVYEQWIEGLSTAGSSVILAADDTITLKNLADNVLQGGAGNISMSVLGDGSGDGIFFTDLNDKIATTTGDIILNAIAGSGAISGAVNVGHLETTGDFGDITVTAGAGGIQVASITTGGSGVEYPGDAILTTVNSGDITTGPISILASGAPTVDVYLRLNASGDITVNGDILLSALASASGTSYLSARTSADIDAGGDIDLNGDVTVEAITRNSTGYYAGASAYLYATAGGDLTITGDTLVSADATLNGALWGTAYAYALTNLWALNNIAMNGAVTIEATAANNASSASGVTASAYLYANAAIGDITITGDVLVSADTTQAGANASGSALAAYALADLYAANNITMNGNVTVDATAINTANSSYGSADAFAYLFAMVGGDITIAGATLVNADATLNGSASFAGSAYAYAYANISDGGSAMSFGSITVDATAVNNAVEASGASAYAYLYVTDNNGSLTINGPVNVSAYAEQNAPGNGSGNAYAYALADLYAANNITMNGNVTVDATAINNAYYAFGATASAYLYANASTGDLAITGDILVSADATQTGASAAGIVYAYALANLNAGGDLSITGDIAAIADANAASEFGSAFVGLYAGNNLTVYYPTHEPKAYAPSFGDPAHALVEQSFSGIDVAGLSSNYMAELEIIAGGVITIMPLADESAIEEAELLSTFGVCRK